MTKLITLVLVALAVLAVSCKGKETNSKLERELCAAAYELDIDKANQLIDRGVNVNTTVYGGYNPLALAILGGAPD